MNKLWTMSTATVLFSSLLFATPALAGKGQSHANTGQSQQNAVTGKIKPNSFEIEHQTTIGSQSSGAGAGTAKNNAAGRRVHQPIFPAAPPVGAAHN
jgi:hypothetical protein